MNLLLKNMFVNEHHGFRPCANLQSMTWLTIQLAQSFGMSEWLIRTDQEI